MKRTIVLSITLVVVLLQGCIVRSLHPFYKSSDIVFRKELINTWRDQDGGTWTIKPVDDNGKNFAYELHYSAEGKLDAFFLAHLFTLGGEQYLDFLPIASDGETVAMFNLHLMPSHSIARLESISESEIQIRWFNEKWLKSLFDQNRIKISHETIVETYSRGDTDQSYVLTANTEELQKFILKYGKEEQAFVDDNTMWLKLTR
jgi:hypothetical protein